ncbi:lytic transglycosylase domain-containing protein [bacterium]|nr:lytic transglycosylase domain-containing protein [bacterium]
MQSTAQAQFGTLLKNRGITSVDAQIYTNPNVNITKHTTKDQIISMIETTSEKYGVDSKLIKALVQQESGYNPNAKSKAGALGLMQLMPATAEGLGVKDPMDPQQNIEGGVKYVKSMLDRFNGNIILALAAYNAGPNAVKKYDGVPPYKETQNYVRNILKNYL